MKRLHCSVNVLTGTSKVLWVFWGVGQWNANNATQRQRLKNKSPYLDSANAKQMKWFASGYPWFSLSLFFFFSCPFVLLLFLFCLLSVSKKLSRKYNKWNGREIISIIAKAPTQNNSCWVLNIMKRHICCSSDSCVKWLLVNLTLEGSDEIMNMTYAHQAFYQELYCICNTHGSPKLERIQQAHQSQAGSLKMWQMRREEDNFVLRQQGSKKLQSISNSCRQ